MKNIPLALLSTLLWTIPAGSLEAQPKKQVIAVEAECLNYLYTYDDLDKFVADISAWFPEDEFQFVEANPLQRADYILRIRYKKDPPGGYNRFHFYPVSTGGSEALPGMKDYAQQETTPQERAQAAATRSPGTVLVPYSEPLLNRPGNNQLSPTRLNSWSRERLTPDVDGSAYALLQFTLFDGNHSQIIWTQKRKSNKYQDIYTPLVRALAVQLYTR